MFSLRESEPHIPKPTHTCSYTCLHSQYVCELLHVLYSNMTGDRVSLECSMCVYLTQLFNTTTPIMMSATTLFATYRPCILLYVHSLALYKGEPYIAERRTFAQWTNAQRTKAQRIYAQWTLAHPDICPVDICSPRLIIHAHSDCILIIYSGFTCITGA